MRVLLTGASGFVGSHVGDVLSARAIPTSVLLRPASSRQFLEAHLAQLEPRHGSLAQPDSLVEALRGVTHVIHCAGCTKAARSEDFYQTNQVGTRNLVTAINAAERQVERVVHVSSLAAAGPCTPEHPRTEQDPPRPVSLYGRSKLAGELELENLRGTPFTILRPPAVYGPRDAAFLPLFKAVKWHLLPATNPRQLLSLIYVRDLAQVIVDCLEHPKAPGKTYFVCGPERVTARAIGREIASQMATWTLSVPLPAALLWPVCLACELATRLTGSANIMSLQKFAELRAPAWVCDRSLFAREVGTACPTALVQGIALTLEWYRKTGWL